MFALMEILLNDFVVLLEVASEVEISYSLLLTLAVVAVELHYLE